MAFNLHDAITTKHDLLCLSPEAEAAVVVAATTTKTATAAAAMWRRRNGPGGQSSITPGP